jgi:hypothetical protein
MELLIKKTRFISFHLEGKNGRLRNKRLSKVMMLNSRKKKSAMFTNLTEQTSLLALKYEMEK